MNCIVYLARNERRHVIKIRALVIIPSLERPVHVVAERELITQNCEWKKNTNKKKIIHGIVIFHRKFHFSCILYVIPFQIFKCLLFPLVKLLSIFCIVTYFLLERIITLADMKHIFRSCFSLIILKTDWNKEWFSVSAKWFPIPETVGDIDCLLSLSFNSLCTQLSLTRNAYALFNFEKDSCTNPVSS